MGLFNAKNLALSNVLINMLSKQQAEKILEPTIAGLGYEFVFCEILNHKSGKKSTNILRVFIDKAPNSTDNRLDADGNQRGGVTLGDCQTVNKHINKVLTVEFEDKGLGEDFANNYNIEVSSPGLDRPLVKFAHFARFIGKKVKIKLNMGFENTETGVFQRNIVGFIKSIKEDENIVVISDLDNSDELYDIEIDNINKANLVPQWDN